MELLYQSTSRTAPGPEAMRNENSDVRNTLHDIYKHKGNPAEWDNARGILLMSHCGKPLCKMLAAAIAPQYNSAMPDTQFGATTLGGAHFDIRGNLQKKEEVFLRFVCGFGQGIRQGYLRAGVRNTSWSD